MAYEIAAHAGFCMGVRRAVEEALLSFYGALEGRGIEPQVRLPEEKVERLLDPAALSRVLGNILTNALKYSAGDLEVTLEESGRLTFSNAAPGLDPVTAGRLFDRFYTVEAARNSTGLGLSIAQSVVSLMGGTIDVESEPGRGTVFTVRVSMRYVERDAKGSLEESDDADALCDVSQGDAPAPRGADLSGVRVLLVEDNELNSEIAVALLESLGAAAETAARRPSMRWTRASRAISTWCSWISRCPS